MASLSPNHVTAHTQHPKDCQLQSHHQNAHWASSCGSWETAPVKHQVQRFSGKSDECDPQTTLSYIVASLVTLLMCEMETDVPQLSFSAEGAGTNLKQPAGSLTWNISLKATEKEGDFFFFKQPQIITFLAWCTLQLSRWNHIIQMVLQRSVSIFQPQPQVPASCLYRLATAIPAHGAVAVTGFSYC